MRGISLLIAVVALVGMFAMHQQVNNLHRQIKEQTNHRQTTQAIPKISIDDFITLGRVYTNMSKLMVSQDKHIYRLDQRVRFLENKKVATNTKTRSLAITQK